MVPLGQFLGTAGRPCRHSWPRARAAAGPQGSPPAVSGFWRVGGEDEAGQSASQMPLCPPPPFTLHPCTSKQTGAVPGWWQVCQGSASAPGRAGGVAGAAAGRVQQHSPDCPQSPVPAPGPGGLSQWGCIPLPDAAEGNQGSSTVLLGLWKSRSHRVSCH